MAPLSQLASAASLKCTSMAKERSGLAVQSSLTRRPTKEPQ